MNLTSIYHRAYDNYCYPLNADELIINIKTGYDVNEVNLIIGDPFKNGILGGGEGWDGQQHSVFFKKNLEHHLFWTTTVSPEFKRAKYYFELKSDTECIYYFEDGFLTPEELQEKKDSKQFFVFPWMNQGDIFQTPSWVNDTVWYQIFIERFHNGNPDISPSFVLPWREKGSVKNTEFFGGDLQGITDKLDYLENLGITGLYLTPIHHSPSSHKYDIHDYKTIDPHFGDDASIKTLVASAHAKGIRVMLDGVFNHCSTLFAPWQDVVEHGPKSKYFDWFMVNEWPFTKMAAHKGQYYSFAFVDGMPKLNTNNPEVIQYFVDVCKYWLETYDIDGIRLDVANEISHILCKELRKELKKLKPDFYILGEIWHDSMPWLRGDEFDSVMNYPLGTTILNFWLQTDMDKINFEHNVNNCFTRYMQQTNDVLFNLLDSHDTKRLASTLSNEDQFYQALTLLFMMPGSPCIYYGTEIGMKGSHDPDCRRCMPWTQIEENRFEKTFRFVQSLIQLRKNHPMAKSRNFHFTNQYENPRVLEFTKVEYLGKNLHILMNCSTEALTFVPEGTPLLSHKCKDNQLLPNGILIYEVD